MLERKPVLSLAYVARNLSIVVGLVLIWRGIWYVLDAIDYLLFGGYHMWTALGGIIFGLVILYWPDKDLKEIEKL
jgi:membrane associated rhomboid family serine protease